MKRYFLLLAGLALAATACQEKTNDGGFVPEPGTKYTLEGTVKAEGFTWNSGAELGLFSATSGVRIVNAKCTIADGAGKANATFTTPGLDLVEGENTFAVSYPYNASIIYASGKFNNFSVSDAQVQSAPGAAANCIAVGTASGTPGKDETFKFGLTPVTAVAKVTVGTAIEKYIGQSIKKVSISNESEVIGGNFNVTDIRTGEIQKIDGKGLTTVGVSVTAPAAIESGKAQDFYINILPADFKGKEVSIVIEVEKDGVPATMLVKKTDLAFNAGETVLIDLSDIKSGDLAAEKWYCDDDTRLLPGLGYAYGQANTFFIQCKNGQTYAGGTYSPNNTISDEVVIDYRVRGNLANITEDLIPEDVTFEWLTLSSGKLYTPRTNELGGTNIKFTSDEAGTVSLFTITHNASEYTVTVKNTGTFAGAPVLVMKKAGKVLWAWTFWNVAADGGVQDDATTTIAPVTAGGYKFAPMDLGQPSPALWNAGSSAALYNMNILYQWGRPFPVLWTSFWSMDGYKDGAAGNVVAVQGPLSLKESLSKVGMIYSDTEMRDWCTESTAGLWGSTEDGEADSEKTIYDPCPKGWKVASLPAVTALAAASKTFDSESGNNRSFKVADATFYCNGYVTGYQYNTTGRPMNMQFANNKTANRGWWWSSYSAEEQSQTLFVDHRTTGTEEPQTVRASSNDRSQVMSVRCIVDEKNR